jgi:response regulator RpfG family c-di-GMP phosphodiesterase
MDNLVRAQILVIDDEPEIRAVLCDLLGEEYDCSEAASAEQGLAFLHRTAFDLVLTDISMSGMSGLTLVPHILAISPDTVVIMISGKKTMESAIEALRAGAFDYIVKPFDIRQVEASVKRGLEHHSLIVAKRSYENHLEDLVEKRTEELDRALEKLEDAYRSTLKALTTALGARDLETHGHSDRVVSFSLRLGREMKLTREQMVSLEFGSLLHDIGKIGVPDAILRKPSQLSGEEWEKMRMHPIYGEQILNGIKFLEGATRVVEQHHEKWDGTGYPNGLEGEEIDINARIFSVADAFDAMVSNRVYRNGRSYEDATIELERCSGLHFDPAVIEAFYRVSPDEWEELRIRSIKSDSSAMVNVPNSIVSPMKSEAISQLA